MRYDAIVVGAGAGGAATAYWLGQGGWQVLVLEKETLPRYKACGGGVPQSVLQQFPFDFSDVVEQWIERVRFRYKGGREVAFDLPRPSVAMVMRDRFDLFLLRQARADVREGMSLETAEQHECGVRVTTTSGETFDTRYLVGADGAYSRVASLARLRQDRRTGMAIEAEVLVADDLLERFAETALFLFGVPRYGYVWIFPKDDHLSLGIGALQPPVPHMKNILSKEMARLKIDIGDARLRGHPLPIYLKREPLRRGRIILVGDAARLVDPLLGEGIRHALASARIGAECLLNGTLATYTERIHQEIGRDLLWARRAARAFYRFPQVSFELAVRNPLFVSSFLRLFNGETSYRSLAMQALPKILLGLPRRLPVTHPIGRAS